MHVSAFNRILGYVFIPIVTIALYILILELENDFDYPFTYFTWSSVALVIGILIEGYFIFVNKRGYEISILVFTNKAMYLFNNNMEEESVKYRDARHVGFAWQGFISKTKKFIVNLDLYFPIKSTKALLRFIYILLYYYCNPQGQIKNRLKHDDMQNLEEQFQAVIQQSTFKLSNTRYTDIYRKKETLLIKVICYCAIAVIAMILFILLVYFRADYSIKALLISITITEGVLLLYVIATTGYLVYKSLKQLEYLPGSILELGNEGIKATNRSGEVWIPFDEDLIINPYDCIRMTAWNGYFHSFYSRTMALNSRKLMRKSQK